MRREATIAIARGLANRARHAEIDRMLSADVAWPDASSDRAARTLLARARLLGGLSHARADLALDAGLVTSADGSAATRAEVACWRGWLDAWPEAETFRPASAMEHFRRATALSEHAMRATARCWAYLGAAQLYRSLRLPSLSTAAIARAEADTWMEVDREASIWAAGLRILNALQLADAVTARHFLARYAQLAEELDHVLYDARARVLEGRVALDLDGSLDVAEVRATTSLALLDDVAVDAKHVVLEAHLLRHDAALRRGDRSVASDALNDIPEECLSVVGAPRRIQRRHDHLTAPAVVHTMPGRRAPEHTERPVIRFAHDPFWGDLPFLGAALSRHAVLISGERGTGKMYTARRIHDAYAATGSRLAVIECDGQGVGLADQAMLSEAIAFDGPVTIILRNVERITRPMADRVLSLIHSRRTGSIGVPPVFVLATSSAPLAECAAEGSLPEAFYQEIGRVVVERPPLRKIPHAIEPLVWHFVEAFSDPDRTAPGVTDAALEALRHYDWPGNIRQLRNEIQRVMTTMAGEPAPVIDVVDLSEHVRRRNGLPDAVSTGLDAALAATERDIIAAVLNRHGGQVSSAADELGLTRQGLYKKIKRLGVDVRRFQPQDEDASLRTN